MPIVSIDAANILEYFSSEKGHFYSLRICENHYKNRFIFSESLSVCGFLLGRKLPEWSEAFFLEGHAFMILCFVLRLFWEKQLQRWQMNKHAERKILRRVCEKGLVILIQWCSKGERVASEQSSFSQKQQRFHHHRWWVFTKRSIGEDHLTCFCHLLYCPCSTQ